MKNSAFRKNLRRKSARIRQAVRDKRSAQNQKIIIAARRGESKKELRRLTEIIENQEKRTKREKKK